MWRPADVILIVTVTIFGPNIHELDLVVSFVGDIHGTERTQKSLIDSAPASCDHASLPCLVQYSPLSTDAFSLIQVHGRHAYTPAA